MSGGNVVAQQVPIDAELLERPGDGAMLRLGDGEEQVAASSWRCHASPARPLVGTPFAASLALDTDLSGGPLGGQGGSNGVVVRDHTDRAQRLLVLPDDRRP